MITTRDEWVHAAEQAEGDERPDHDELAVGDVEYARHPVLQAQSHGDEGEDATEQKTGDDDVSERSQIKILCVGARQGRAIGDAPEVRRRWPAVISYRLSRSLIRPLTEPLWSR